MSSTYSTNLAIELIGTGDQAGSWGLSTNNNLGTLIEEAISGYATQVITDGADTVITIPNGASGVARNMFIECTGTLTAARNLIVPANKKLYFIYNNTVGGFAVTVKVSGQTGISVPNGAKIALVSNGTDIVAATNYMAGAPTAPTATFGTNTAQIATTAFVQAALQALHPVGSIYMNATNATNPATLLGFGTWTAFGAGRVPVGFNAANALFDTAEETGGSYDATVVSHTHAYSGTVSGQSQSHSHPISISDPGHVHTLGRTYNDGNFTTDVPIPSDSSAFPYTTNTGSATTGITASAGNASQDHNHTYSGTTASAGSSGTNANIQPYITVYMWKRTA
jgi:hypothetical protein